MQVSAGPVAFLNHNPNQTCERHWVQHPFHFGQESTSHLHFGLEETTWNSCDVAWNPMLGWKSIGTSHAESSTRTAGTSFLRKRSTPTNVKGLGIHTWHLWMARSALQTIQELGDSCPLDYLEVSPATSSDVPMQTLKFHVSSNSTNWEATDYLCCYLFKKFHSTNDWNWGIKWQTCAPEPAVTNLLHRWLWRFRIIES